MYLVERIKDSNGWDQSLGFVVAAKSELSARKRICKEDPDDQGCMAYERKDYMNQKVTSCQKIGTAEPGTSPGVILQSFRNG